MTQTIPTLTIDLIESVIEALPIQNRAMIRLLLLQYLDLSQEDILYMSEDQPDSRFQAGGQPEKKASYTEGARDISARADQYRNYFHQKRERPWLQIDCLKKQISLTDVQIQAAENVLTERFEVDAFSLKNRKQGAVSALPRPEIRQLDRKWEQEEITEPEYQTTRLLIEYQTLLRRRERQQRRLNVSKRDFENSGISPMQDHEIGHIWGIPLGSLSGRKVKALHLYLTTLQTKLDTMQAIPDPSQGRVDLWRETISALSHKRVDRSIVSFMGGIERTEEALLEKLEFFGNSTMPEEQESTFWQTMTRIHDTEHSGAWFENSRAIFALQRFSAILSEIDPTLDDVEQDLLLMVTPKTKAESLAVPEEEEKSAELSVEALGVLNALIGESDDKRRT
ncbi:MAG: hypothetical protein VST68_12720 [Nitrospirota bacterium]|nr:hypothetical protein [Nitrospirota bacterium]